MFGRFEKEYFYRPSASGRYISSVCSCFNSYRMRWKFLVEWAVVVCLFIKITNITNHCLKSYLGKIIPLKKRSSIEVQRIIYLFYLLRWKFLVHWAVVVCRFIKNSITTNHFLFFFVKVIWEKSYATEWHVRRSSIERSSTSSIY